jgi:opacity protein-like surface antigen
MEELDNIEPDNNQKYCFISYNTGSHNETMPRYKDLVDQSNWHNSAWKVTQLKENVPEYRLDFGYGYSNKSIVFTIGRFDRNSATFTLFNQYDGYNSIETNYVQLTYRTYLVSTPGDEANRLLPYIELGAGWYFVNWEWRSKSKGWVLIDWQTGNPISMPEYNPNGDTNMLGYHAGIGLNLMLGKNWFIGIKTAYIYAETDYLKSNISNSSGAAYWGGYDDMHRIKIELTGTSTITEIGLLW